MKKTITLLLLSQFITIAMATAQAPPDVSITDIKGNKHQLYHALEQGYIIFLDFSFIDCQPCNEALPEIIQITEDYNDQNLLLWYISDRDQDAELQLYFDSLGINAVIAGIEGNGEETIDEFGELFNFFGFPTLSIICPDKMISWDIWPYTTGAPEWRTAIESCHPMPPEEVYEPYEMYTSTESIASPVLSASLFPNPLTEKGTLTLDIKKAGTVRVGLYDYQGRYLLPLYDQFLMEGHQQLPIHPTDIQNGYYILKIETPQKISYLAFIKS